MQLQTVKVNILIPLEYDINDFGKSLEDNFNVSKEQARKCKETGDFGSGEWFHYCFRKKPIEANTQNTDSPLLTNRNYQISRIEMDSVVRAAIGLHHNEDIFYTLSGINQKFQIGKVRILFTGSTAAFLHIETFAFDLTESAALGFINAFSMITSSNPKIQYKKKIDKNTEETVTLTLKTLVQNIVQLQSYLPVSVYKNPIKPYFQICMTGTGNPEDKENFFESVRSLSKRASSKSIEDKYVYVGKEPYISRFVGDRAVCIFGDTGICGEDNLPFITDIGNGLIKTATENYLTVYVFLISLQLIIKKNDPCDLDIQYLLNVPMHWSDEDNIREFFEECLWEKGWKLEKEISKKRDSGHVNYSSIWNPPDIKPAYDGNDPYVFLSYSHRDTEVATGILRQLQSDGFRVWYDNKDLAVGSQYDERISYYVRRCGCFIALLSQEYLKSRYCKKEILFAIRKERTILPIYLEDVQLPDDLDMHIGGLHAISKFDYCDADSFYQKLYECQVLSLCRGSER